MPLWGKSSPPVLPKWITVNSDKASVFVTDKGWVQRRPGSNVEEVLVSIGNLDDSMGNANITAVTFNVSSITQNSNSIGADIVFSEKVNLTGSVTLTLNIISTVQSSNVILTSLGTGANTNNIVHVQGRAAYVDGSNANTLSILTQDSLGGTGTIAEYPDGLNANTSIINAVTTGAGNITITLGA